MLTCNYSYIHAHIHFHTHAIIHTHTLVLTYSHTHSGLCLYQGPCCCLGFLYWGASSGTPGGASSVPRHVLGGYQAQCIQTFHLGFVGFIMLSWATRWLKGLRGSWPLLGLQTSMYTPRGRSDSASAPFTGDLSVWAKHLSEKWAPSNLAVWKLSKPGKPAWEQGEPMGWEGARRERWGPVHCSQHTDTHLNTHTDTRDTEK